MIQDPIRLILIRYNKKVGFDRKAAWYDGRSVNLDPEWLAERLRLFHTYCWPSLARQTEENFHALLFMDPETDPKYIEDLVVDERIHPVFTEGGVGGVTHQFIGRRWRDRINGKTIIWTTRLDSDDALSPTYLEGIDRAAKTAENDGVGRYFYFTRGQQYIEPTGRYREYIYPGNAFGTLVDRLEKGRTVMSKNHDKWHDGTEAFPIDTDQAKWCMVIHGQNVLNSARGTDIDSPDFRVGKNEEL